MEMASEWHQSVIRPPCKQFVRRVSSNLLQSVFKVIVKGFVKEAFSDQLRSVSTLICDGLPEETAAVQLQVLPKRTLMDLKTLSRLAAVIDQALSHRV